MSKTKNYDVTIKTDKPIEKLVEKIENIENVHLNGHLNNDTYIFSITSISLDNALQTILKSLDLEIDKDTFIKGIDLNHRIAIAHFKTDDINISIDITEEIGED